MNENTLSLSLIWEDTPKHPFNNFGIEQIPETDKDHLYATTLALIKKITLEDLVDRIINVSDALIEYKQTPNLLSGFILAISCISSFPLNLKYIKNDDVANNFLSSIQKDLNDDRFISQDSLLNFPELQKIVQYYEEKKIIEKLDDRYYIHAFVLNSVDIK